MNLREAAAWRVMTEVTRRNPSELRIREFHPGGGLWDCLGVTDCSGRTLVSLNRSGSLRFFQTLDGTALDETRPAFYEKLFQEKYLTQVVEGICAKLRIPAYKVLPPTTKEILVYRYISALMDNAILSNRSWECRNGFYDTSGLGGGMREDFDAFPLAKKNLIAARGSHIHALEAEGEGEVLTAIGTDLKKPPAEDYWFIQINGKAELCLSLDAVVWDRDFNATELYPAYQKRRKLWPLIYGTAGFLLA